MYSKESPKHIKLLISLFLLSILAVSCQRDDAEPILPEVAVSRLYVSLSDIWPNDGITNQYNNLMVFDPADSIAGGLLLPPQGYNTLGTLGFAQGVTFNPFLGSVLQVTQSVNQQRVVHPTVSAAGVVSTNSIQFFADYQRIDSEAPRTPPAIITPRGLALQRIVTGTGPSASTGYYLYLADLNTNRINMYANPKAVNWIKPTIRFNVSALPFGLFMQADSLFVSYADVETNPRRLQIFQNLGAQTDGFNEADSTATATALATINLSNGGSLRGLAFSSKLDVLAVADNGGDGGNAPAVHLLEGAKAKFSQGGSIASDRTITGALTGFINPTDVAIDDRNGKNLLYVSDRGAHAIFVFSLMEANGNATPIARYVFPTNNARTPEFIHLDAREGTGTSVIDSTGNVVPANAFRRTN